MAAMCRGDHAAAWAISDAVLAAREPAERDDPRLPYHLRWVWDGRPWRGRDVLVRCYHGLGDTMQFARFLPVLRPLVASLTLEVPPALLPLLTEVPGPDRLVSFDPAAPLPPAACDVEIMELPHLLRLCPDAVPPLALRVMPAAVPAGAVGLCWRAGDWDPDRSVPDALMGAVLSVMAPLTPVMAGLDPAIRSTPVPPAPPPLFSLQLGPTALPVRNPRGAPAELAETAALVAGLSLVITVDSMIAHLAGSLGRPTWLLLKHDADWRWMERRADSPWYPSMRLFRQPRPGDWATPLRQVVQALRGED